MFVVLILYSIIIDMAYVMVYNREETRWNMNKEIIAQRLKTLRESARLSQAKMAQELNIMQPLIAKYETAVNIPSYPVLLKYADYFDVSCDYLLGRADNPQGKLYSYNPKSLTNNPQMKEFVEMCFDPNSSVNAKLKDALLKLLEESQK